MANSVDPDQTAPIGAVCSGSTLFASMLNSSVMLGNYLQQTTFQMHFFLGALRVKNNLQFTKDHEKIPIIQRAEAQIMTTVYSESMVCLFTWTSASRRFT